MDFVPVARIMGSAIAEAILKRCCCGNFHFIMLDVSATMEVPLWQVQGLAVKH